MTDPQKILYGRVRDILEENDSLCMDVPDERDRLAKAIAIGLTGEPKPAPAPEVVRKVNENERKVLAILAEAFDSLARQTKLERNIVRRACRSLAKKGLAKFEQTLWNDDGPAGSGYRATEEGAALITPCDICQKRATYDYWLDPKGEHTIESDKDARHIRECEEHYQQSANRPQQTTLA
jgi:hypothetical protein